MADFQWAKSKKFPATKKRKKQKAAHERWMREIYGKFSAEQSKQITQHIR